MRADAFLTSLGKDDEDDVPRKRRTRKTAEAAAPAPAAPEAAPPAEAPAPAPEADSAPPAAEPDPGPAADPMAALIQTVQDALFPEAGPGPASNEPVHKTSVDLRWTLKQGLADLVARDRRGPKAEINEALELWLRIKGIDVPEWNG